MNLLCNLALSAVRNWVQVNIPSLFPWDVENIYIAVMNIWTWSWVSLSESYPISSSCGRQRLFRIKLKNSETFLSFRDRCEEPFFFFFFFFFRKIDQSRYWTQTMIPTRFSWLNKNLEPKQADMIENSDGTRTVLQYLMSIKAYNSMLSKRHRLCTEVFPLIAWAIRRNISNWISNRKLSRHQALKGYSL